MPQMERYCQRCAENVKCREEQGEHSTALFCPNCDKKLATHFGHIVLQ